MALKKVQAARQARHHASGEHPARARHRLFGALFILAFVLGGGTLGYMTLEGWDFLDSLYMTIITLGTVGFEEVHPLSRQGEVLTILVIVLGVGATATAIGTASQIMLEDRIQAAFGRRVMKVIEKMHNHFIVCGYGRMGRIICQELTERGIPFVVVENLPEAVEDLERLGFPHIRGNATEDEVLEEAGIHRARGLVSVVTHDAENVFIVLTARGINPRLTIVARAAGDESVQKLVRAGANKVVSPYSLGGFRIAQAVHSPTVLDFLEKIVHDKSLDLQLGEVIIHPGSRLAGVNLADSGLRKDFNLIILAIKGPASAMVFNPPFDETIKAGDTLVVLGHASSLKKLSKIAQG